jgi:H+/Cl- antiporter ClcA
VELVEILRTNGFEVEAIRATGGILAALLGVGVGMSLGQEPPMLIIVASSSSYFSSPRRR